MREYDMNILEEIRNCPVEWKELGEVAFLKRGKAITSKTATDGPYPVISGGQKPAYLHGDFNREGETITVAGSGAYAGFVMYWKEPIFVSDAFSIKPFEEMLNTKYLYHCLLEKQEIIFSLKKGSGVPHVYPKDVSKLLIPIPSLEIQEKIVQKLDKMTEYVTELTSELTSRKKQYSYYRDKLLLFEDEVYQVEWKTLLDVSKKVTSGGTPDRSNSLYYGGSIPWLRTQEVDFREIHDTELSITEEGLANSSAKWIEKNAVIVAMYGATAAKVGIAKIPLTTNQACCNIEVDEDIANYRYVYHWLTYNYEILKSMGQGSQSNINAGMIKTFKIPVPSLEIQSRIVQVLDNFDKVCNDLNIGLPKEIELRQKQYEYFREKLLTFVAEGEYTESRVEEWDNSALIRLLQWVFGPIRVKVGQVVNLQRGKRLVRKQLTTSGSVPVYQNSLAPLGYYTESNRVKNTSFVICAGAAGEIGYSAVDFWAADDVYTLETSDNISDKFMYYVLLSKQDRLKSQVRKASIPRLSKDAIDKVTFYLPSLTEQKRIVSILDNFNTLTNSLSEGLPKEIELRQKQYEYWREQLLNFTRQILSSF